MRIAFLTERMLLGYGVDLVVDQLASGLSARGFDVSVCCNVSDGTFLGRNYRIENLSYRRNLLNLAQTEQNASQELRSFVQDQDLLIACTFPYYRVATTSTKPWIAVDFGVVPPNFYSGRIRRELQYHQRSHYIDCFPKAHRIVCISNFLRDQLPDEIRARASVIYPGIDHYPKKYLCDVKEIYEVSGPLLLYAGRSMDFSPYKNTTTLLSAVKRIREGTCEQVRILISTSCSEEERRRLEKEGAIVLNGVTMEFMPSIYHSADIFVTATQWEGFDLPLLEASYFGLPVVAYRIGAHPEIVAHEKTGNLASNEEEFTNYLSRLVQSDSTRKEFGANGAHFASSNFTWTNAVDKYAEIISEVARSKPLQLQ